jgi:inhibitor of KinA sporulation pathway (predicted exonuclease)
MSIARRSTPSRILAIDLELTCDEPTPPDWKAEIIQLGVVELDTVSLEIGRTADWLARPRNWDGITPFCTSLTGITRDAVKDKGRPWPEVAATFRNTFGPANKVVLGWGRDDIDIAATCADYSIADPMAGCDYVNVAQLYRMLMGSGSAKVGLEDAMDNLSLQWPGRQHDALVDARATAIVWAAMARRLRGIAA